MALEGQQGGGQAAGGPTGGAGPNGSSPAGGPLALDDAAFSNLVNQAVTAQLRRNLPKALEEALAPLRQQLAGGQGPGVGEGGGTSSGGVANGGQGASQPHGSAGQAPDEREARLTRLEAALKEERAARAKERQEACEKEAFQSLREELKGKVRPEALDSLSRLLFHADRAVRVKSDGSVVFLIDAEEYSMGEGVAAYLARPEAAMFLPAPGYDQQRPRTQTTTRPGRGGAPPNRAPQAPQAPPARNPAEKTLADFERLGIGRIGSG